MNPLHFLCFLLLLSVMVACNDTPTAHNETPIPSTNDSTPKPTTKPTDKATTTPNQTPTQKPTLTPIHASIITPTEPTMTPTTNAQRSSELIYIYRREGGFAGFCDTLTVRTNEAYWESCQAQSAIVVLKSDTSTQLRQLANQYAPFETSREDNPGGSDSMTQSIHFYGIGNEQMTGEVESTLNMIASELLREAYQTP